MRIGLILKRPSWCGMWLAAIMLLTMGLAEPASASSSRDDLVQRMLQSMIAEIPEEIHGIALMRLDNEAKAPVDMDLLREDLELELIGTDRFAFVNRQLLEAALKEMDLCSGMACFMDPKTLQEFGHAKGIDALLIGKVIDSSARYAGLEGEDYFLTVLLQAMSTSTASVIWQKEITGVNSETVVSVLGGMPPEEAVTKEKAMGQAIATFLRESSKVRDANIRTVSLMDFENRTGKKLDTSAMYRHMASAIVSETDLKLVDRQYMEEYLKEQGLWFNRITEASQKQSLGRLYGIDAFIYGSIRETDDDQFVCVVRVNDVESNVDVDAKKMTGTARNMKWALANMLRNVSPSEFYSNRIGTVVTVDGKELGVINGMLPLQYQLSNGMHEVQFSKFGYETAVREVLCEYGQGQKVSVDLERAYAQVLVKSDPVGAQLWVNGEKKSSRTPVNITLPYGEHRFQVKREMCEGADDRFTVDAPMHEFTLQLPLKTRNAALTRSFFLPGLGQHYKGQHGRGWGFTLAAIGASGFIVLNESARTTAVDEYEVAKRRYESAVQQDEMDSAYNLMVERLDAAESKKKLRNYGWMALGGVWVFNVIDAALGWPAADAGVQLHSGTLMDGTPAMGLVMGRDVR